MAYTVSGYAGHCVTGHWKLLLNRKWFRSSELHIKYFKKINWNTFVEHFDTGPSNIEFHLRDKIVEGLHNLDPLCAYTLLRLNSIICALRNYIVEHSDA